MGSDATLGRLSSLDAAREVVPCGKLAPFDKDERIWWAFRCAAAESLKQEPDKAASQFVERLQTWSVKDIPAFAQAYQRGSVAGAGEALKRYYEDLVSLVRAVLLPVAEFFDAVYNPQMYALMAQFYSAPGGSDAQVEALDDIARYLDAEYPALAQALRTIRMATAAIQAVAHWIETNPNAGMTIALAVSSALGKILGEEAATLLAVASSPALLGFELGRLCGNITVEVGLVILGF